MKMRCFRLSLVTVALCSVMCACTSTNTGTGANAYNGGAITKEAALGHITATDKIYNEKNSFGYEKGYAIDVIDANKVLPEPPSVTDAVYFNDWYRFYKEKEKRDTPRGNIALADVVLNMGFIEHFSDAYGLEISQQNTPQLWKLMSNALENVFYANKALKKHFKRTRPFVQLNADTGYKASEEEDRTTYSYPSTHTAFAFATALIMAEVNPAHQNAIFKKGYECGQSRVILGYHYQSDVEASRLLSSMVVAQLHSNPEFLKQIALAKEETRVLLNQNKGE